MYKPEIGAEAEFGQGKKYRYALWRIWDLSKPRVMFVGLNPSRAVERKNDNTIIKVVKIARHNGFGGVYMMNIYPFITAYPSQLSCNYESNIINNEWLEKVYDRCAKVVYCWGSFKQAQGRAEEVMKLFVNPMCLAINKDGAPKHPLYCLDETILIPYKVK